jgi:hypothetical protein
MIKAIPMWASLIATLAKSFATALSEDWLLAFGWLIAGGWIVGIGYAYLKNKELPMLGPSEYRNGENQVSRTIGVTGMTIVYIIAVWFDGWSKVV